ncbi:MAG: DUF177 domain-containing protein [Nitrospinae bacterium]|nr:DUF177 domain-containing protein [Nitrospinota bacterium]MBL7019086.1 DUF177 domain-containing protein [Nitrospinaceae bacterium]
MIFDIEKIYEEGLDFEVLEAKERFNLDSPDSVLTEDIKVQGRLEKSGQTILCQGSLETGLTVTCTRCLSDFTFLVKGDLKVHFTPREENSKPADEVELTSQDIEQEFYNESQIDLSSSVRDLILLSLPQVILCQEDCAGLCLECGTNLNKKICACKHEGSGDPRLAVLQQLKDKLK